MVEKLLRQFQFTEILFPLSCVEKLEMRNSTLRFRVCRRFELKIKQFVLVHFSGISVR